MAIFDNIVFAKQGRLFWNLLVTPVPRPPGQSTVFDRPFRLLEDLESSLNEHRQHRTTNRPGILSVNRAIRLSNASLFIKPRLPYVGDYPTIAIAVLALRRPEVQSLSVNYSKPTFRSLPGL